MNHESSKKSLPFGGWTYYWVGDPDAGYGREQPGGWCYNVFPFIEEQPLRELGAGQTGTVKQNAITKMMGTPVEAFICPTRRPVRAYPGGAALNGGTNGMLVAKTDYAANGGSVMHPARANTSLFLWAPETNMTVDAAVAQLDQGTSKKWPNTKWCNGIMCESIGIQLRQITDGASHTLMLGEKYLNPDRYETGNDLCDNEAITIGWNYDSTRFTILDIPPMQDRRGFDYEWEAFGSAHAAVFYVAYCDASVHPMSYNVDPVVFSRLGGRNEGQMASPEE